MKKTRLLDEAIGNFRLKLEVMEGDPGQHDYGIPRQSWILGAKFVRHFGADRALQIVDERAERAAKRRDYDTARRWRTLITAIHALQEDERLHGERSH
jgi:hypothetical protein